MQRRSSAVIAKTHKVHGIGEILYDATNLVEISQGDLEKAASLGEEILG
jgi:hypothetical protein